MKAHRHEGDGEHVFVDEDGSRYICSQGYSQFIDKLKPGVPCPDCSPAELKYYAELEKKEKEEQKAKKKKEKIMDITWLYKNHVIAYEALPSPYQNDNCLEFWWDKKEHRLECQPKKDQEFALGTWVAYYDPKQDTWLLTSKPIS